jgi:3-oxoacyl-ACP reductase-like protein
MPASWPSEPGRAIQVSVRDEEAGIAPIDRRFRLDGRAAVVTGASRGLGAAVCRDLARAGAVVVATARDADALGALVASLPGRGTWPCPAT